MRAGKADLEKEGAVRFGFAAQPPGGEVADEVIGVQVGGQLPIEGAETLIVVLAPAVEFALLLDMAAGAQGLVPLIEVVTALQVPILVFDDVALVEAQGRFEGRGVHLADVDAVVAAGAEILDP